jgi:D-glycero-alpha-D-manno-heptose-7-phosphate kinase
MFVRAVATAPVRICDLGGWTDTWFAEFGNVFNIAVDPGITVEVESTPSAAGSNRITIESDQHGMHTFISGEERDDDRFNLPASVVRTMAANIKSDLRIRISSGVPSGSALGTSASVCFALVAALDKMQRGNLSADQVAVQAWEIESGLRQTGVQDQFAAALGGLNFIEITKYPAVRVDRLTPEKEILEELENRLLLFWLGSAHKSGHVHELVIEKLQGQSPGCAQLQNLRDAAAGARRALLAGDFKSLGVAMSDNTLAQAELHPDLVSMKALAVIRRAASLGALGWKVNGAGGEGGSLTILASADPQEKEKLIHAIESSFEGVKNIPVKINRTGVVVSETGH